MMCEVCRRYCVAALLLLALSSIETSAYHPKRAPITTRRRVYNTHISSQLQRKFSPISSPSCDSNDYSTFSFSNFSHSQSPTTSTSTFKKVRTTTSIISIAFASYFGCIENIDCNLPSMPIAHAFEASINEPGREKIPSRGFQTKSGLKYFDLREGDIDVSPRYGQLVSFHYSGYYRAPSDDKLDLFDSSYMSEGKSPFLHKHGNGRLIRGIDEGLHTMKVGGKRRVIIPKSIGYTEIGLGPLPADPQNRKKLGNYIDFLDRDEGELIFDLELLLVADDENDQGYYEDEPVSQDDVRKLVLKSLQVTDKTLENIEKTTPNEKSVNKQSQVNPRGPSKI